MNRRKFISYTGASFIGGMTINSFKNSALAVEATINDDVKIPEDINDPKINLEFKQFKVIANNVKDINIKLNASIGNNDLVENIYETKKTLGNPNGLNNIDSLSLVISENSSSGINIEQVLKNKQDGDKINLNVEVLVGNSNVGMKSTGQRKLNISITSSTIYDNVIDNFEKKLYEDKGKTVEDYYSGDLSGINRIKDSVLEGNYALRFSFHGGGNFYALDSPNKSFKQGDTARWNYKHDGNVGDIGPVFAPHNNGGNYYMVVDRTLTNDLRIFRYDNGNYTTIANNSVKTPANQEIMGELFWGSDGTITFTVYNKSGTELGSVSGSDSNYSDSNADGWGWRFRSDTVSNEVSTATVDNARLI